jgi:hypothetical protein
MLPPSSSRVPGQSGEYPRQNPAERVYGSGTQRNPKSLGGQSPLKQNNFDQTLAQVRLSIPCDLQDHTLQTTPPGGQPAFWTPKLASSQLVPKVNSARDSLIRRSSGLIYCFFFRCCPAIGFSLQKSNSL